MEAGINGISLNTESPSEQNGKLGLSAMSW